MKLLQGVVSKTQKSVISTNGRTVHILRFEVRGWPVRFESTTHHSIDDDDEVILAGTAYRRSFVAFAYRNLTTGSEGHDSLRRWIIIGAMFSSLGLLMPIAFFFLYQEGARSVIGVTIAGIAFGAIFGLIGGCCLYIVWRAKRALRAIQEASP